jgi:hypothetical protein
MINLCRQNEARIKTKSMFPANKSHIASMNLRTGCDHPDVRPAAEEKPRSSHKYKKSLILQ